MNIDYIMDRIDIDDFFEFLDDTFSADVKTTIPIGVGTYAILDITPDGDDYNITLSSKATYSRLYDCKLIDGVFVRINNKTNKEVKDSNKPAVITDMISSHIIENNISTGVYSTNQRKVVESSINVPEVHKSLQELEIDAIVQAFQDTRFTTSVNERMRAAYVADGVYPEAVSLYFIKAFPEYIQKKTFMDKCHTVDKWYKLYRTIISGKVKAGCTISQSTAEHMLSIMKHDMARYLTDGEIL